MNWVIAVMFFLCIFGVILIWYSIGYEQGFNDCKYMIMDELKELNVTLNMLSEIIGGGVELDISF